jgi:hypothetical protein
MNFDCKLEYCRNCYSPYHYQYVDEHICDNRTRVKNLDSLRKSILKDILTHSSYRDIVLTLASLAGEGGNKITARLLRSFGERL